MKRLSYILIIVLSVLFSGCFQQPIENKNTKQVKNTKIIKIDKKMNLDEVQKRELLNAIKDANVVLGNFGYIDNVSYKNFLNKKYLYLSIENDYAFNSIHFTEKTLAKKIYEDYILQILPFLQKAKEKANLKIDGYNIFIVTYLHNFVTDDLGNIVGYSFYLPADAVKEYSEYKITDKQLAEKSIILINKHRVSIY